jgi:hypothetical protein
MGHNGAAVPWDRRHVPMESASGVSLEHQRSIIAAKVTSAG